MSKRLVVSLSIVLLLSTHATTATALSCVAPAPAAMIYPVSSARQGDKIFVVVRDEAVARRLELRDAHNRLVTYQLTWVAGVRLAILTPRKALALGTAYYVQSGALRLSAFSVLGKRRTKAIRLTRGKLAISQQLNSPWRGPHRTGTADLVFSKASDQPAAVVVTRRYRAKPNTAPANESYVLPFTTPLVIASAQLCPQAIWRPALPATGRIQLEIVPYSATGARQRGIRFVGRLAKRVLHGKPLAK